MMYRIRDFSGYYLASFVRIAQPGDVRDKALLGRPWKRDDITRAKAGELAVVRRTDEYGRHVYEIRSFAFMTQVNA